jgi:hypothetical protein
LRLITFFNSSSADSDGKDPEPKDKLSEVHTDTNEDVAVALDVAAVTPSDEDGSNKSQPVVPILTVAPPQENSNQPIAPSVEAVAPSEEVVASSGDDKR